jgi:hypothetical protein
MYMKQLRVLVTPFRDAGLLVAVCPKMPGLTVYARSLDELDDKLPGAIRELIEAGSVKVIAVETVRRDLPQADGFEMPAAFITAAVVLGGR